MSNCAASHSAKPPGKSKPELADIVRAHAQHYRDTHRLSTEQSRALTAIATCRTPSQGGHLETCQLCGATRAVYHSCSNRHCPKCQGLAGHRWCQARRLDLLPVPYFHLVFTLPHELNGLGRHQPRLVYNMLFAAAWQTLACFANDPNKLGAKIGVTAVLHTWQQSLAHHIHLHCLVTGGGLGADSWRSTHRRFLFPVKALAKVFRAKYLEELGRAIDSGRIDPPYRSLLATLSAKSWIVYAKPPAAGPEKVLNYLSRYVHRTAITSERILGVTHDQVRFRYRDRTDGNHTKVMTLAAEEFLGRFLLHVLPKGFTRVRHFGLLANSGRTQRLERCRQLLGAPPSPPPPARRSAAQIVLELTGVDITRCPTCAKGTMCTVQQLPRFAYRPDVDDSS